MAGLPAGVQEVQRIPAPGGGYYVLGSDGGVFAMEGAAFHGSVPGLKGDTLAGKHKFAAGGMTLNPRGGYTLTDTEGRSYSFDAPPEQQTNTVTADPAMLAFLRTSGLTMETAANQVRQQTGSINAALQTSMGDIRNNYDESARKTQGSYEARGILRSSSQQQAADQVERQRLAAQTAAGNAASGQIAGLNTGLVNQVLAQQQKGAELGLQVGTNQDWDATLSGIKRKYAPELAAGGLSS